MKVKQDFDGRGEVDVKESRKVKDGKSTAKGNLVSKKKGSYR